MSQRVPEIAHLAATLVEVPADHAFERLSEPEFVGGWALGSMGLRPAGNGVYRGTSLFDGSSAHVEIHPFPALGLIDYAVGTESDRRARIFVRVTPGPVLGRDESCCLVALHALRSAHVSPERWAQTCAAHEAEILLIKAQLERTAAEAGA